MEGQQGTSVGCVEATYEFEDTVTVTVNRPVKAGQQADSVSPTQKPLVNEDA